MLTSDDADLVHKAVILNTNSATGPRDDAVSCASHALQATSRRDDGIEGFQRCVIFRGLAPVRRPRLLLARKLTSVSKLTCKSLPRAVPGTAFCMSSHAVWDLGSMARIPLDACRWFDKATPWSHMSSNRP
jgi:hypothetical protein